MLLTTDLSDPSRSAEMAVLTVLAPDEFARKSVDARHQGLIKQMTGTAGRASSRIESGDETETITRAWQEGYSPIMVGKHGWNRAADKTIGSTGAKLRETMHRPILIVTRARR
ncbi:adenine nucleotide alpha hydrolase family protein [Algiphilus aromaticivorans]|uniref:universal stress protein n=1 Tax=Algiphilus aromaticivorans TaxID=382454 RepID=UPI0005C1410F|nr:universal stress protein [Algiphilus aromaticivorans]